MGLYKRTSINTECNQCHAKIIKTLHEYKSSDRHFCNASCSATYWNAKKYPVENRYIPIPRVPAEKVELTCATCSKKFIKYKSYIISVPVANGCRFCSKSCQAIYANRTWNKSGRFGINKSRCETILRDIILKEFPNINLTENNRKIVPNSLELDLYFPDKKIAIELNGPCHYIPMFGSDELNKTKNKDLLKIKFCQENGIKLFIINVMGVRNQKQMLQETFDTQLKPHFI